MKRQREIKLIILFVTTLFLCSTMAAFRKEERTVAVLDFKGDRGFVDIVREEVQSRLKARGFRIVVATSRLNQDIGNLERELEVQHSKYGAKGDHHATIGYFRGADSVMLGTVEYTIQHKAYTSTDILARVSALNTNYRVLSVEVKLELVDLKTREQLAFGAGSAKAKYSDDANSIASRTSLASARRQAATQAAYIAVHQLLDTLPAKSH